MIGTGTNMMPYKKGMSGNVIENVRDLSGYIRVCPENIHFLS